MKKTLLFLFLFSGVLFAKVRYQSGQLVIENDKFIKVFALDKGSGPIALLSLYSKSTHKELLAEPPLPCFEFVIDGQLVTANDAVWSFQRFQSRQMGNGGEEVAISFVGTRSPVKGLGLILYQQYWPGSTLIREKLELLAPDGKQFPLTKLKGQLHFVFPQYSLTGGRDCRVTEIRIGSWAEELLDYDPAVSPDERNPGDHNLANCHMFHPKVIEHDVSESPVTTKGPLVFLESPAGNWITAYEHASQDSRKGLQSYFETAGHDAQQGVEGTFLWEERDEDFHFIGVTASRQGQRLHLATEILRGGYLDGELIRPEHPYETVWNASIFFESGGVEQAKALIRDYLFDKICEHPASRRPSFYYNTWGMQRDLSRKGFDLRGVMTYDRIIAELHRAAELGVDLFVLDDGWNQAQGDWTPHRERLPHGLGPIKAECDKLGITLGVWLSPMGIDSTTERYRQHPEWVIRDSRGKPIRAQWGHPAFDFVSGFYDLFVQDCKRLIDQGVRFFKWDAINTFNSSLANLDHGSSRYTPEERRQRYEYLLPVYVARAMKELSDYEPELVIEMDLTEARRCMVGLAPLSQGKYFWMNNGASGYGDYSVYRTKSMRTIANQFAGLIPLELFTYANYPHPNAGAQRYNVNTSLLSGHGFWGALQLIKPADRRRVGKMVAKAKRVLPFVSRISPRVTGRVGASPEIYELVDADAGAGMVLGFSGSALKTDYRLKIDAEKVLAVLNNAYKIEGDSLVLPLVFPMPDATREAFILPNNGKVSILSSTCWLDDVNLDGAGVLEYRTGAAGRQVIRWQTREKVSVQSDSDIKTTIREEKNGYTISVITREPADVTISSR